MDTTKMTLSALLAASLLGNVILSTTGKPVEVVAEPAPDALLDAATPQCVAEVRKVAAEPRCTQDGVAILGNDKGPTDKLWQCNGAIMGPREQACLTAARAKLPLGAGKAEAIE